VVTDLSMPGMDGWQLVQSIRSLPFGQSLPIIVMSAGTRLPFGSADLEPRTAFLAKPFALGALLQLMRSMLDTSSE
jgi:CheY-like chemotaxis protein